MGLSRRDGNCKYTKEEILEKIGKVTFWGHTIPLPYGIVPPGRIRDNLIILPRLQLPMDLSGKRILDVGAWDGFYSFECEKRGARVVAIDNLNRMKRPDEIQYAHLGNLGFETVKDILDSKVEFINMDAYDVTVDKVGKFDIVLFLGILYHLKHPLLALERIAEVTIDQLIIESEWLWTPFTKRPFLEYIHGNSLNQDPTNHCTPNTSWLKSVLTDLGFTKIEVLYTKLNTLSLLKSIINLDFFPHGRIIIKAYK